VRKLVYLATAAVVALLILVPTALAQTTVQRTTLEQITTPSTSPLPESGGLAVGSVVLPAAALLLGSGVLAYAVLRRR
jgi:hypothetical protein